MIYVNTTFKAENVGRSHKLSRYYLIECRNPGKIKVLFWNDSFESWIRLSKINEKAFINLLKYISKTPDRSANRTLRSSAIISTEFDQPSDSNKWTWKSCYERKLCIFSCFNQLKLNTRGNIALENDEWNERIESNVNYYSGERDLIEIDTKWAVRGCGIVVKQHKVNGINRWSDHVDSIFRGMMWKLKNQLPLLPRSKYSAAAAPSYLYP